MAKTTLPDVLSKDDNKGGVWRGLVRLGLSVAFIGSGVLHFVIPKGYAQIVPPVLPAPETLVYVSGVAEVAGGLGLLIPQTRRLSAWGLIALLVAVYPANVYHAVANDELKSLKLPIIYHIVRLPMQFVFIWLLYWSSLKRRSK